MLKPMNDFTISSPCTIAYIATTPMAVYLEVIKAGGSVTTHMNILSKRKVTKVLPPERSV